MLVFTCRVIHQMVRGYLHAPKVNANRTVDSAFRCLPLDIDIFGHMNNARYLQNAELARWNLLPASKVMARIISEEGMVFLAVENSITYHKPIWPFQKYIIQTSCKVKEDDKWMYYTHEFKQHPEDVPEGKEAKVYCTIDLTAVIKERSGKTIKPSMLMEESPFYKELVKTA